MATSTYRARLLSKILLLFGFAGFTFAVLIAHADPASQFEVSVYSATPLVFWIGIGLAILAFLFVSFGLSTSKQTRGGAYLLGGASFLAVAGLPLLRSYYFFGAGDSLTHLGWVKDISSGVLAPLEFLYPGTHTMAVTIGRIAEVPFTHSLQLTVLVFVAVYIVFIPLIAQAIIGDEYAVPVALALSMMLLPVNNLSVFLMSHPTSQAIEFAPVVLFLAFKYLSRGDRILSIPSISIGALLALSFFSMLSFHPQQAVNIVLIFVSISVLQVASRYSEMLTDFYHHTTAHHHTVLYTVTTAIWISINNRAEGTLESVTNALLDYFSPSGGPTPADTVATQGMSLSQIGGSLPGLFLKLFSMSLVVSLIAGVVMLLSFTNRIEGLGPDRDRSVKYLSVSFIPLFGLFLVYFLSSVTSLHFRQLGFLMLPVTVLGALGVVLGIRALSVKSSPQRLRTALTVFFAVAIVISTASLYLSPYIFRPSSHITEPQVEGYSAAFETRGDADKLLGIRRGGGRYADFIYGTGNTPQLASEAIPPEVFNAGNMTSHYDESNTLIVTRRDRLREVSVYRGLRYSQRGFERLPRKFGLNRVYTNGGVRLYHIE
ncbi:cytochrome d ubiquinol oxidase subunit II [Salinigranum halophilum]|uniref:cytochrome d ubiquinol oxidase subunit II n=1 Tax=Salinigranum halophilum TaxID=2565931 RepID=UPI0010A795FF|nr:cytochrome d ubiquinol oxidase subunit II [Salinigranum halophilum]